MTTPNDLRAREAFRRRRSLIDSESVVFFLAAVGAWVLLAGFVWLAVLILK
jgi:hypothetical protein